MDATGYEDQQEKGWDQIDAVLLRMHLRDSPQCSLSKEELICSRTSEWSHNTLLLIVTE